VWFATGTGVSPFLAALRAREPVRPRYFAVGVRSPGDAVLRSWVEELTPVRWAFSRFTEGGQGPRRVTDLVGEVPVEPGLDYFLCGNAAMIHDVAGRLRDRGADPQRIHEELFF
jgi:ferredoxin-NADP reductase